MVHKITIKKHHSSPTEDSAHSVSCGPLLHIRMSDACQTWQELLRTAKGLH